MYLGAQHLTLRDWKYRGTFHSSLQHASFIPFWVPLQHWLPLLTEHRSVCIPYLHEVWQLSYFLIMKYVILKGSKDVSVLILMLYPAPLDWLRHFSCLHHYTGLSCSLVPWAAVLKLGVLGAASQFPAETETGTSWVMQEFFVSLGLAPRKWSVGSCSALVRGCAWPGSRHRDWLKLLSP